MIDFFQMMNINKFLFVDAENISNPKLFIDFCNKNNYLNFDTQIICFIGANKNQDTWYTNAVKYIQALNNQGALNLTQIRIPTQGANALDMVIASYIGLVVGQKNTAEFVIVANDTDYASVVQHFSSIGVKIHKEKISQNTTKSTTKDSSKNAKKEFDKAKVQQCCDNLLRISKEKRPLKKSALGNVLKNNNHDFITEKDLIEYEKAVLSVLISRNKLSVQDEKLCWK